MKSVGEVMAIGRTFEEAIQKGIRMIGQGLHGFVGNKEITIDDIRQSLSAPTDKRILVIEKAFFDGMSVEEIHELTKIDRWFLHKLERIFHTNRAIKACGSINNLSNELLYKAKCEGFTDFQIARAVGFRERI